MEKIILTTTISSDFAGKRLDHALSSLFPEYSRARLQSWVKAGNVLVDNQIKASKWLVSGGENIQIEAELRDETKWRAENIDINVAYCDDDLIVVDKPVGIVVHPAAGHYEGTLVNALLYHYPELEKLPRAGIIHRIDKDTSGLLLVARNLKSHNYLVEKLQEREISRKYFALCHGHIISGGKIDKPIGRHHNNRLKKAVVQDGKNAVTHYRVSKRFKKYTLLEIKLETGRTHQIRVHMESIGYPLVGDSLYSRYKNIEINLGMVRQALHATELEFYHPVSNEKITVKSELPKDLKNAIDSLSIDS